MSFKWTWLEPPESGGAGGSTYSKLFRNQGYTTADLLVREALQNSWDAALQVNGHEDVLFEFQLRFIEIKGRAFDAFVEALDLRELLSRRQQLTGGADIPDLKSIELAFEKKRLRTLMISDFGATGLDGHPKLKYDSRLYRALYALGSTKKADSSSGQGGSFGFGKSALITASAWRTIIASTRFSPSVSDKATQRLVGWTYWGEHEHEQGTYEGRAILGSVSHNSSTFPEPLEDAEAEAVAKKLGFPQRQENMEDLGSSLLLLEPELTGIEAVRSLEKYWWPAIEDHRMSVSVIDYDGTEHVPQPRTRPALLPFIRAYEIATGVREPGDPSQESIPSRKWKKHQGRDQGVLALTVDQHQEVSPQEQDAQLGDWRNPTVALVRRPRMVVAYKDFSSAHPIRGVFVASDDVDEDLRLIEPPLHDSWSHLGDGSTLAVPKETAQSIMNKIRAAVRDFAKQFAPVPYLRDDSFALFGDLLGAAFNGNSPGVKPKPPPGNSQVPSVVIRPITSDRVVDPAAMSITVSQEFKASVPTELIASRTHVTIEAQSYLCEDLDDTKGSEIPCQTVLKGRPRHVKAEPLQPLLREGNKLRFTVLVPGIAQHHRIAIVPKVTVVLEPDDEV